MAREKIFAVGFDFPGGGVAEFDLGSDQSLLDADIVVFSPNFNKGGISYISAECIEHWRRELETALDYGRTVLVFLVRPQQAPTGFDAVSSYAAIPSPPFEHIPVSGSEMRATGDLGYLSDYWRKFSSCSRYEMYLQGDFKDMDIILKTRSGERIVGFATRRGCGVLILVPPIHYESHTFIERYDEHARPVWSSAAVEFGHRLVASLVEIHRALQSDASITPAPEWSSHSAYRLDREDELETAIWATSSKIEILQAEQHKLEDELEGVVALKRLLYGQGQQLEGAILDALKLFGFEAKPYRDTDSEFDSVFTSAEGRFLGEAEGKDRRPIDINKLRQLTENLEEDFARDGIEEYAKGVLFGNPHRLRPPDDRPDDFTTKCIRSAEHRRIALVRTADMFEPARYLSENDDPDYARLCREVIRQSEGEVVVFPVPPRT